MTDVIELQQFLNTHGAIVASSGPGSPGNGTILFGSETANALAKYQKMHGLKPDGVFGPATRAFINAVISGDSPKPVTSQTAQVPSPVITPPVSGTFTKDLSEGMTDSDVARLEHYLNTHQFLVAQSGPGSLGHETNNFGSKTASALKLLQTSAGIPSTGFFGPKTRAWVNAHL